MRSVILVEVGLIPVLALPLLALVLDLLGELDLLLDLGDVLLHAVLLEDLERLLEVVQGLSGLVDQDEDGA